MNKKKIIFEDSPTTPMSKMLIELLSSNDKREYQKDDIIFTSGNRRLCSYIEKYKNLDVIVFVDCSPGNCSTIRLYRKLKYKYHAFENILIVPIPCIEYYMICILIQLASILRCRDYDIFLDCLRENSSRYERSFEVICKAVINHQGNCKRNKLIDKYPDMGKFWISDCNCTECNDRHLFMRDKANAFFKYFPISISNDSKHNKYIDRSLDLYKRLEYHYPGILSQLML